MTDAVRTERAAVAAPTGVSSPRGRTSAVAVRPRLRTVLESWALLLPIVLLGLSHADGPALWLAAIAYLAASSVLAILTPSRGDRRPWIVARIGVSVLMVAAGQLATGSTGILSVVYLPIVAVAAFAGRGYLVLALVASIVSHFGVETLDRGTMLEAGQRTLGFAAAAGLAAFGTRREVVRMQRGRDRLRRAVVNDRRRARQIAGVEAIGRILAARGPTDEALDALVRRPAREFGYRYVSVYLGDQRHVRLGAQRGYRELVTEFDGERGIVGRVMRTREPAFIPDVAAERDYWGLNPDVRSEICVPLLADDEFLGFINVEATGHELDETDLRVMVTVADRLAAALIIGRERQRLSERADLFRHLHEFSEAVSATLQPTELHRAMARAASNVVRADAVYLHVRDRDTGRYLLAAVEGGERVSVGAEAIPGSGVPGRALEAGELVVDEVAHERVAIDLAPVPAARDEPAAPYLAASLPLGRDREPLGVLTLLRADRGDRFTDLDRGALAMLGQQAALAITNVKLHADVAELALRDPLTGLFNRRYLDPALEQLLARRARQAVAERVPIATIMFDLDHFSELNNRHGHQAGDEVLRAFGAILRTRMRATDLVARFGGEEFAAVLYRATLADATRIADEVRRQLAATPFVGQMGEELTATVSAGCAAVHPEDEQADDLLRAADVALFMAKRAGRDRVCAA